MGMRKTLLVKYLRELLTITACLSHSNNNTGHGYSCDCKCKFNSTNCNSNQNWNNDKYQCECKKYLTCKKKHLKAFKTHCL